MRTRIGHLLVRDGLITEAQLSRALEVQGFAGGRIGTLLMERGVLGEEELGRALALQHGCGFIPWSELCNIPAETIAALPIRFALKHNAVPYERDESHVRMALRDPSDLAMVDELVFVTGKRVLVSVAPEVRIYQALEKYYGKLRTPRYAILAEKLSRSQKPGQARSTEPPPSPDFFEPATTTAPPLTSVLPEAATLAREPAAERRPRPGKEPAPRKAELVRESSLPTWASFLAADSTAPGEPEAIAWDESTGGRSKARVDSAQVPPPLPFEEGLPFDFGGLEEEEESAEAVPGAEAVLARVRNATDRDTIAGAILEALVRRFPRAAIFSSRSEGISGWVASGEGVNDEVIRGFSTTWTDLSVFSIVRLSRSSYLGPLPQLPRHDRIAEALGGWPEECVVEPVFIGEKPVAFLLGAAGQPGSIRTEDLGFLTELAQTASSAFENAIRLKKKEI
jgi:type II secretion system (T2SS) protein E